MEALGKIVGVSWQTVQQWESEDGTAPNRNRQPKVAEALEVSVPYLVTGDSADTSLIESRILDAIRSLTKDQRDGLSEKLNDLLNAYLQANIDVGKVALQPVGDDLSGPLHSIPATNHPRIGVRGHSMSNQSLPRRRATDKNA